jgi:hypothetical protein
MPASRSVVSVLVREQGDLSLHLEAGPAGGLRPGSHAAATGEPASPSEPAGAFAARWQHRRSYSRRTRLSQSLCLSEDAVRKSLLARSAPMKGEPA